LKNSNNVGYTFHSEMAIYLQYYTIECLALNSGFRDRQLNQIIVHNIIIK